MALFTSIFDRIVCNCFCGENKEKKLKKQYAEIDKHIASINGKYDIHILKVAQDFHIKNLYPVTDQVEKWTVFVIGNDMTYIHVSVGDFHFPNHEGLLNNKGSNILTLELNEFLEPLWRQTLGGNQLQFYMSVQQKLYFVNTYPFINDNREVIGAIMFIRPFTSEKAQARAEGRINLENVGLEYITPKKRLSEESKKTTPKNSLELLENLTVNGGGGEGNKKII